MSDNEINRHFKTAVLNSHAYHVPDSTGLIKLDAMENPYQLTDDFKQQWQSELVNAELNRYPDADMSSMRETIKQSFSVSADCGLIFGNGSDELIQIVLMAINRGSVMSPAPSFVMYQHLATLLEHEFIAVPLTDDFSLDLPELLEKIETIQPSIIFLAWPNNPTGVAYKKSDIEQIIKKSTGLVIVDEAYHAFANETMLNDIKHYPNLLVMRTLSKLGLAGLRLGFLVGQTDIIEQLEKVRMPYNVGTLNQLSVSFICRHIEVLTTQTEKIKQDRAVLFQQLSEMDAIHPIPSATNFILFKVSGLSADHVHQQLIENKILIKNLSKAHPSLTDCLRVTVGTEEENTMFINALKLIFNHA
ncbi:MAG: histidinol-phosphate transaminase [Pseudomonadota bacterium]